MVKMLARVELARIVSGLNLWLKLTVKAQDMKLVKVSTLLPRTRF